MADPQKKIMELDPEVLKALTAQIKSQLQTESSTSKEIQPTTQKPIYIGPFKLNPLHPNQSFKTKEPVTLEQQVLIDYSWNARNKAQLTMALHALAYYFSTKNSSIHKPLTIKPQPEELTPNPPPRQLMEFIRMLEVENTELKMRLRELEGVEKENKKFKTWIMAEEKKKEEGLLGWKKFPQKINEVKKEILERVVTSYKEEQVFYQEVFRRLAVKRELFEGITFAAETYQDGETDEKGCSYITCNINLDKWKDIKIENVEISFEKIIKLGLLRKLYISQKKHLVKVPIEKLMLALSSLMEQRQNILECEFQTIPPSFGIEEISNAKSYITIRRVSEITMVHTEINDEDLVPDSSYAIEDQVSMFRTIMYNKPFINIPGLELVAEDEDNKIFTKTYALLKGTFQFPKLYSAQMDRCLYYHKIRAYHMTTLQGDIWKSLPEESSDEETAGSTTREEAIDKDDPIMEVNITNMMEA